jgi:hypothetical protein
MFGQLFLDHPRELGLSWASHGGGAIRIGFRLIGAGVACLIHAVVPGLFTQTAGRTVSDLHNHMLSRRSAAPDPRSWPDYEI